MIAKLIEIKWNSNLSIFASESFLKSVGDEYGWIGGFDEAERLKCIIPFTIIQKVVFRMARFRVETIPVGQELDAIKEKEFLNSVIDYLRSKGVDMIIPATTNTIFRTIPNGAIAAPYGTFKIDLTQSEEKLFRNMSSSHRRKVRLAKKRGVKIKNGMDYLRKAYLLIKETFKRSNISFMRFSAFERMVFELGENVKVFIAESNEILQGCIVIPYSNYSAYYVYGGSITNPVVGATNLLHWEAIKYFKNIGVGLYDFVGVRIEPETGSKQEGLKNYKERFGGRLVRGYMWKYSIRPIKFLMYNMAVRIMRGGDIVDYERHKL